MDPIPMDPPLPVTGRKSSALRKARMIAKKRPRWHILDKYTSNSTARNRASRIRTGKSDAWNRIGKFETRVDRYYDEDDPDTVYWGVYIRCIGVTTGFIKGWKPSEAQRYPDFYKMYKED